MLEFSTVENKTFQELNPLFTGSEQCAPGHVFGPAVRDYYLIHYVLWGKGCYRTEGEEYQLKGGDAFLIKPGYITVYEASRREPWHYVWIAFNGALAEDFQKLPPVLHISPGIFREIRAAEEITSLRKEFLTAVLFRLYYELFQNHCQEKDYAKEIHDYIMYNYMCDLTVEGMAGMMNLDRRYLSRLFKKRYGIPIRDYLQEYRMEKARQYLAEGNPVSRVSEMVGYRDVCNFSKMFKKINGISPAAVVRSRPD